jgi:hypothetical protein
MSGIRLTEPPNDMPCLRLRSWSGKVEEGKSIALSDEGKECQKQKASVGQLYICVSSYSSSPTTHPSSCAYTNTTTTTRMFLSLPALSSSEATISRFISEHMLNKHPLQYDRYPTNQYTRTWRYGLTSSSILLAATSRYPCCCSSYGRASLSDEISCFLTSYSRGYCILSAFVCCEVFINGARDVGAD